MLPRPEHVLGPYDQKLCGASSLWPSIRLEIWSMGFLRWAAYPNGKLRPLTCRFARNKKKHVDWNQFVWSYCGEKNGAKTSYLGVVYFVYNWWRFHSSSIMVSSILAHQQQWIQVVKRWSAECPSNISWTIRSTTRKSPMSWRPCIQHHGPFVVLTPWKINMEHNHGGLEDHFPF